MDDSDTHGPETITAFGKIWCRLTNFINFLGSREISKYASLDTRRTDTWGYASGPSNTQSFRTSVSFLNFSHLGVGMFHRPQSNAALISRPIRGEGTSGARNRIRFIFFAFPRTQDSQSPLAALYNSNC